MFTDSALEFLAGRKSSDPFLLYCAYTSPHDPRMAPEKFRKLYDPARITLPENFLSQHPFDNGELKVRDELLAPFPRTPQVVKEHIAAYYAMVSEVDAQIGRILDAVERGPAADNTYVILAGDNGLAVGQHGLFGKQSVYEHSVRVPLIISGPGVPKGKTSGAFAYLFDLFPTICEWAGLPVPDSVDGMSLATALRDPGERLRDSQFFAYRNFQRAVRTRDWKLIHYMVGGQQRTQLFQISRDPWERTDLAARPDHAPRVREMRAKLMGWQKRTGDPLAAG
jgi:arylsulfatase A-like enzyme